MTIEEFTYEGTEFHEDPKLAMLVGAQWGSFDKNKRTCKNVF
jgi:hypothetical protein